VEGPTYGQPRAVLITSANLIGGQSSAGRIGLGWTSWLQERFGEGSHHHHRADQLADFTSPHSLTHTLVSVPGMTS